MARATTAMVRLGMVVMSAALITGCSKDGAVPGDELAKTVKSKLEESVGQPADKVTCPDDLPAEVGATTRCTLEAGGESIGVTVTTTGVDGKNVDFDIKADDEVAD